MAVGHRSCNPSPLPNLGLGGFPAAWFCPSRTVIHKAGSENTKTNGISWPTLPAWTAIGQLHCAQISGFFVRVKKTECTMIRALSSERKGEGEIHISSPEIGLPNRTSERHRSKWMSKPKSAGVLDHAERGCGLTENGIPVCEGELGI